MDRDRGELNWLWMIYPKASENDIIREDIFDNHDDNLHVFHNSLLNKLEVATMGLGCLNDNCNLSKL